MSIGIPREHVLIVNSDGKRIDSEELVNSYPDSDPRVLINDEIGKLLYVGDLDLYFVTPLPNGDQIRQKITEIGSPRLGTKLVRHQIGGKVVSLTPDSIIHVRKEDHIIKVRADKLQAGMILETGEKVHW